MLKDKCTRDLTPFVTTAGGSEDANGFSKGVAFFTNGCSRSCSALGRLIGSRCRHCLTKSFPSSERSSGIAGSSLLFPILNMAATFKNRQGINRENEKKKFEMISFVGLET